MNEPVSCKIRDTGCVAGPNADYKIPTAATDIAALLIARRDTAALRSGAQAVHPGYGFLSESPKLADAVMDAGLAWVGPPPEVLELAGDKVACRNAFEKSGFPVLPSSPK